MNWINIKNKVPKDQQIVLCKSKESQLEYSVLKIHYQQGVAAFWFTDILDIIPLKSVTMWTEFK